MAYDYNNYVGNNDFRGFLAANAPQYLGFTGNDGNVDMNALAKSIYGTGRIMGDEATTWRQVQSADNRDPNYSKYEYTPSIVRGLYDNWQAAQTNATTPTNTTTTVTGAGGAGAQQGALYDTYANQANDALARALKAYNDSRSNIGGQFDTRLNELRSQRGQTEANVSQQRTQNQQHLQSSRNAIRDSASQGLRSLLAALGAQGAGGSSAAQFLAPEAVNSMATAQRSGAAQTFGENAQQIDTSWNNFLSNWNNEKKRVEDWRTNQERQAQADYDTTANRLNDILAGIRNRIQPAEAFGGQIANIAGAIPNTIAQARTYTGETPVYSPASLSSYQVATGPAAEVSQQQPMDSNMPWLNSILNRERERRNTL